MMKLFNKLRSLFIDDEIKNKTDALESQLKQASDRINLLEKKLVDQGTLLVDHHKTIAAIAMIQSNLLTEMDRAVKNASLKRTKTTSHTTSSKDDDFIN
jgi:predicted  nucleic acid-binding Zn-ribbon protein